MSAAHTTLAAGGAMDARNGGITTFAARFAGRSCTGRSDRARKSHRLLEGGQTERELVPVARQACRYVEQHGARAAIELAPVAFPSLRHQVGIEPDEARFVARD